jgi:hypothetical protein
MRSPWVRQVGHRDLVHFGIECKTLSNETRARTKRNESTKCPPPKSSCACGLPHGNGFAGVTLECMEHNARIHLSLALNAELLYRNPDIELGFENPERTLEKHPLMKLVTLPIERGGLGFWLCHLTFCMVPLPAPYRAHMQCA